MASEGKKIHAADCASRAGKFAFGLDEAKAVQLLRKLADEVETGKVLLHSVSTSCHATHDEFTVREVVIQLLEEAADGPALLNNGPRILKD
ncbi:MAG TPA: hypothetical protein VLT16_01095 [Candidatus Limnocylindrales bacterium]|nr:hypothetical protein [Candidatus Limnocylindrales bacterium]